MRGRRTKPFSLAFCHAGTFILLSSLLVFNLHSSAASESATLETGRGSIPRTWLEYLHSGEMSHMLRSWNLLPPVMEQNSDVARFRETSADRLAKRSSDSSGVGTNGDGNIGASASSRLIRLKKSNRVFRDVDRRSGNVDRLRFTERAGSGNAARKSVLTGSQAVRRNLAEIVHLVQSGPDSNGAARIPVVERSGVKDGSDDKQRPKKIKSPYPPAQQIDLSQPKIESWTPRKNRYLLALCVYGRLSNQEQCLRNYLIVAAILQRTLIIPTESCGVAYATFCWRWDNIVDVTRMRACLAPAYGNNETVITVDEYAAREGRDVAIDHIACCSSHSCFDNWALMKEHYPHITLPEKLDYPSIPSKDVKDFLSAYAPYNEAPVISLGDAFALGLRGLPFFFEGGVPPFKSTCADIWQPPPVIENFVKGFIDTFLGSEYAAVHLRRSDFAKTYLKEGHERERGSFLPIVTVAHFIIERLRDKGASVVYLATDASPSEIQLLEKLFLGSSSTSPLVVVRLPEFPKGSEEYSQFAWVKKFQDLDSQEDGVLRALAEKHICANARFFIGTPRSTFSSDIFRLRVLHGRMNDVDAYLGDEG